MLICFFFFFFFFCSPTNRNFSRVFLPVMYASEVRPILASITPLLCILTLGVICESLKNFKLGKTLEKKTI